MTLETTLDPAKDTWVIDHCPSYVIPSLPMMSVLDLFAQAASSCGGAGQSGRNHRPSAASLDRRRFPERAAGGRRADRAGTF